MEKVQRSLWDRIRDIVLAEGVELFDVDQPTDTRRGGVLRVYITRLPSGSTQHAESSDASDAAELSRGGISFDDCVRVTRKLLDIDEQDQLIPENCTLEVSSPGINRRLRLPVHFAGAVGERVKVKFRNQASGATQVLCGQIVEAHDTGFSLEGEAKRERIAIDFQDVKEAQVDFKF